jgi:hypothetical protein
VAFESGKQKNDRRELCKAGNDDEKTGTGSVGAFAAGVDFLQIFLFFF